jgi:ketosteroid isomerase-like protein
MKTTRVLPLLAFLLSCPIIAVTGLNAADTGREADHAALRQLRDKVAAAINNADSDALAACFAKEFAFTAVNQAVLTTPAQFKDFFNETFHSKDALVTGMKSEPSADILTRFIGENVGVCYGSTKDTFTLKSGGTVTMNNRWSATVVKEDGVWKVALAHAGTDFLNNPVLDRAVAFSKKLAIIVGLAGLVVGFILGRLVCWKKTAGGT